MSEASDQHATISKIRDLAIELGRTPTKAEALQKIAGLNYKLLKIWAGNWAMCIHACGLDPLPNTRAKKINNQVFERDIVKHLDEYRDQETKPALTEPTALTEPFPHAAIISDIHWPFHQPRVIDRFYRYVGDEKPKWVIINGDARDRYSHAKFPRSHNNFTPREEDTISEQLNREFWAEIKRLSPESQCYQMMGNHDVRPLMRVLENYPEAEDWIAEALKRSFTFDGVTTIYDPREELILPGAIMIHHGYRSKLGDHMSFALHSAVVGHTHRPGVVWRKVRGGQLFELNCGLAGDPLAKGLSYTSQKITDWVNAFGVIDEDGPRNIIV